MKRAVLDALNRARAEKRFAALVRRFPDGEETLFVDGRKETGADLPESAAAALKDLMRVGRSQTVEAEGFSGFVQIFAPPLRLFVIGGVHITQALAPMAQMTGYQVQVIDPRGFFATEERFPGVDLVREWPDEALEDAKLDRRSAVVALTHDPKFDDVALDLALRSDAFYIAALGSKKNAASRKERLAELGHDAATLERISGPAGLDIGAKSPAEIAIAVMAEMTAALRKGA